MNEQWQPDFFLYEKDGTAHLYSCQLYSNSIGLKWCTCAKDVALIRSDHAQARLAQRWRKAVREYGEAVTIGLHPRIQDFIDIWQWAKDYDTTLTAGPTAAAE